MENKAFIYIPDISGFTKFVTETEISHSEHIISELISIILNSNTLNLKVSEVEGDAVLFYKLDSPPSLDEIYKQSKEMFLNFHSHLKQIEKDNVCQCGACRTTSSLSVKFVGHLGNFKEVSIQSFTKLIGSDVILAHRLLKNNVPSKEYLLITENFFDSQNKIQFLNEDELKFKSNVEYFDNFGEVSTKYINFSPLLKFIPKIVKERNDKKENKKSDVKILIKAKMLLVHSKLIDINSKLDWVPGIKEVKTLDNINRINTTHICTFDNRKISFTTTQSEAKKEVVYFSERATFNKDISIDNFYKLKDINGNTELSVSFKSSNSKFENKNWFYKLIQNLKLKIILFVIRRNSKKTLSSFKKYCENISLPKQTI